MKPKIVLKPLTHKGHQQIGVGFAYNNTVKSYVKRFPDIKWSQTHSSFYVLYTPLTLHNLFTYLRTADYYVDYSAFKRVTKTKPVKQPIVRADGKALYRQLTPDLKDLLKGYANYLRGKRLSKSTVNTYGHFMLRFLFFAKDHDPKTWNQVTIERFMEQVMAKESYSISSHRQCVSAFKHFTSYCQFKGFDASNFARPKKSRFLPTVLSKEEVIDLLRATKNLKHRAIIGLLYSGGLRIGELLRLQLRDIDFDRSQIYIKQSKGRKDRTVMLGEVIKPLLINYVKTYRPQHFFVEGPHGQEYSGSSVRNFLKKACKAAAISKVVTPHTLRHSYATHMLENGVDIRFIQELLGHSKPETTMIYTHVAQKDLMRIENPLDATVKALTKTAKEEQKVLLSRKLNG